MPVDQLDPYTRCRSYQALSARLRGIYEKQKITYLSTHRGDEVNGA